MAPANALIVGAGVCGPVAAMALRRAGIDATLYEARPEPKEDAGSYLTVATNGLDALRAIDACGPVFDAGFPTRETVLWSGTGKRLGTIPIGATLPDGTVSQTIKRAHLHRVLHDEAVRRGVPVEFGKRVTGVEATSGRVLARFEDGSEAVGDVLIGCDGIR
jgi:FAD-dependent urate hydroxylase